MIEEDRSRRLHAELQFEPDAAVVRLDVAAVGFDGAIEHRDRLDELRDDRRLLPQQGASPLQLADGGSFRRLPLNESGTPKCDTSRYGTGDCDEC